MDVEENTVGDALVLSLAGKLDSNTAKGFEDRLMGLIDEGKSKFVIDFGKLEYISSAGLRVLLMAAKKLKAVGGSMALSSMSDHIKEVFEISGFSSIFAIYDDADSAVAGL